MRHQIPGPSIYKHDYKSVRPILEAGQAQPCQNRRPTPPLPSHQASAIKAQKSASNRHQFRGARQNPMDLKNLFSFNLQDQGHS
jgi:hypothetical protein